MTFRNFEKIVQELYQSRDFFSRLEKEALEQQGTTVISLNQETQDHFHRATYAALVLYSLGNEELQIFERDGVVHNSTIEGASLASALTAIHRFTLHAVVSFSKDNYEQLSRTCQSAGKVLEKTRGCYCPRL